MNTTAMEYSSTDLFKMISNLVRQKSYSVLEQLVLENKSNITITMLNELFELPHESVVQEHPALYRAIIEIGEINKTNLTLRHTVQLASIKMVLDKWSKAGN